MATYSFNRVMVYGQNPGGVLKLARNGTATVIDDATDTDLFTVESGSDGRVTFTTTDVPTIRLRENSTGFESDQITAAGAIVAAAAAGVSEDAAVTALWNDPGSAFRTAADADLSATYGTKADVASRALQSGLPTDATNAAGVDPTGVTDCGAAIQSVLDAHTQAADVGMDQVLRLKGTFKTSTTLVIKSSVDLSSAVINYTGPGVAVKIGDATAGQLQLLEIRLGDINCTTKPTPGWVAGTVGLEVRNTFRSRISFKRIIGFETGLSTIGDSTYGLKGVAYNTFMLGSLNNNKVNQKLDWSGTGSFCNQNTFIGGSHSHGEGTYPAAGQRHIQLGTAGGSLNNNVWVGCSLEGSSEEFILDCYGNDNEFIGCRWEFVAPGNPTPPVKYRSTAARNVIRGGYDSGRIVPVEEVGAVSNSVMSNQTLQFEAQSDGGMVLSNSTGGSSAGVTVMRAAWRRQGDSTTTGYLSRLGPGYLRLKTQADTNDRFNLNVGLSNFMEFGPGNLARDVSIGRAAAGVLGLGTAAMPLTTGTTAPAAGAADALPATPAGYLTVNINGTVRKLPYY